MSSILKVDTIQDQSGNNIINESGNVITIGASGDTITVPAGATVSGFTSAGIDDNATSVAITINSSEQVGIGTTSPDHLVHISASSSNAQLKLQRTGSATASYNIAASSDALAFSDQAASTERMRITSTGLGIGTSAPSTSLHISQSQPIITLTDTDDNVSHQLSGQSSSRHFNLKVDTGGSSGSPVFNLSMQDSIKLSVLNSGNVGIGTTSPSSKLEVTGAVLATVSGTGLKSVGANAQIHADASSGYGALITDGASSQSSHIFFQTAGTDKARLTADSSGNFLFGSGGATERMRINSSGNVGIGTTSPGVKLEIKGADGDADAQAIRLMENTTQGGFIKYDGNTNELQLGGYNSGENTGIKIARNDATTMFNTGGSERMRILSNGRIGMNRTAVNGAAILDISHPGSTEYGLTLDSSNTSGTQYHLDIRRGGTQAGYLVSGSTSVTLANSSDERLKENIENSGSAIQDIKDLKVRQFDWKDNIDTHKDFGFVAQELHSIIPEAVAVGSDELDNNGKPKQSWGVDYSHIVPRLVKAVQEQQTKIQELEARITTLEANNP